ncbi:MAG: response regulator transcription factor, partial [Kangiellaceae bacterium]|nr:response regulator transcription factor [Kangiellaceae bacterium]
MPTPIKVLLVDDQMLVREGIKSLLNLSDKVEVVGEAQDGTEIENALAIYSPDVILLDLSMPKMDGIATLNWLAENEMTTPVIILTTFDDHEFILRGIQAGAMGYLLKDVSLETLIEGIETVHSGKRLMQPALTERLMQGLQGFKS